MTLLKLIFRNLVFYRSTNTGTLLGTALATAILVGALIVGDSVRYSLREMVSERLGKTEYALDMGNRYFRTHLADELEGNLGTIVAPILRTRGTAILPGTLQKARPVQVVGVDERFEKIGSTRPAFYHIQDNEVIINQQLAAKLGRKTGDEFLLRLLKIDYLSTDAPFSRDSDLSIATRVKIKAIASTSDFGHFNLKSHQIVPNTVFISLSYLADIMDLKSKANILLIAERNTNSFMPGEIDTALEKVWTLDDIGLSLELSGNRDFIELKSDHIFIEPNITRVIRKSDIPVFTYFVNEIKADNKITPYSFISAPGSPVVPEQMQDDEIIVNSWLAADLEVNKGDRVTLRYYVIGPMRRLTEEQATFRIRSIVPLAGIYADQGLMPDFPGLASEDNCRDWDPGIPVDLNNIRRKDEVYWDFHGGTPKAFITLNAAQNMWKNRFGDLTAIRFVQDNIAGIEQRIKNVLHPKDFGFIFQPLKEEGIRASRESVDFAELFLGLSFFVIIAALLLTSLLFVLTIGQRAQETGLYIALGYPKNLVGRILLYEYGLLALLGGLAGAFLGILYNQIILFALRSIWKGAVSTTALSMHIDYSTILTGTIAGIVMALLTMVLTIRKQAGKSVIRLQAGLADIDNEKTRRITRYSLIPGFFTLLIALILIIYTGPGKGKEAAGAFFGSGFLLLISGMAFTNYLFDWIRNKSSSVNITLFKISLQNMTRKKVRSLMLVGLLASGLFIVFTVGANRHGIIRDPYQRSSGTGGFALFGESQMPVLYDLNSEKGQDFYGLDDMPAEKVGIVPIRVKEGDDASCLNLNRVSAPQLLGLDPAELELRKAFTFSSVTEGVDKEHPWLALDTDLGKDVIPGIADETVIIWGLGKTVGDTLTYLDEKGKLFYIKLVAGLANSIFQGNIVIAENILMEKYPSLSGHRMFLIDVPPEQADLVSQSMSWAMQDLGIMVVSTADRLEAFNQIENTYLSIFLILGGFGLILGTIGLGIVVVRNILERRGELALLKAVGYSRRKIRDLILSEHIFLLLTGTACGFIASLIAVLPALMSPGMAVPYLTLTIMLMVIIGSGVIWTYMAIALATRGDLLPALRNE